MKRDPLIALLGFLAVALALLGVGFILLALWTAPTLDQQQRYLGTGVIALVIAFVVGLASSA